ncbi:hypothetical protein [Pleionea mediterranea]|jgi:hypothetical protein|uniref:Secreted protein n=1 Tax=Pleionea mediterranea TaxID=523701 RepID=A0A316GHU2_9GAMM|nr:hypothetical protein [Pleionea mediterranea]PWK54347.1 hypothetical protein C8D97_101195 [Pleionea mediterranea]
MKYVSFAFALLVASISYAGYTNHYVVNISSNIAYGSMVGARNSADNSQFISCAFVGLPSSQYGVCSARDTAGTYFSCTTTEPYHVDQIRGLSNESYLYIRRDGSKCDYIYSSTGSQYHQ